MKNYLFNPLFEKSCPGDVNFTTGILIKSDIETVWNTVCKAENVKKYFTSDAKHDLDSIGEVLWIWGDEAAVLKVINVVKNEKIVFEWNANSAEYRIKAEFSFENKNEKVKVRIKET
ncbi:MAG: SRPBCC domain-containing protein, partial [Ignavibacteria bacterium]|nr:SRPBCC domain-containing protein [Ignavibacteria bacterium]